MMVRVEERRKREREEKIRRLKSIYKYGVKMLRCQLYCGW